MSLEKPMDNDKKSHRLQFTLKPQAFKILNIVKKEMENSAMQKLPDSIPINMIIQEWNELRKLKKSA